MRKDIIKGKRWKTAAAAVLMLTLLAIGYYYYTWVPGETGIFPRCPIKSITGVDCPSCGSQRALHAALHGELRAAIGYNPFILIVAIYLIALAYGSIDRLPGAARIGRITHSTLAVATVCGLGVVWCIVRNAML